MRIYVGNPFKRRPTNIFFDKLSIGFSLFGGWRFSFMRGIDNKAMDLNSWYNQYGVRFESDVIYNKFGKGYKGQGWGIVYHSKH